MPLSRRDFTRQAAAFTSAALLAPPLRALGASEPVVETTLGKVRGIAQPDGTFAFKGIPFAASTAGAGRFMPPRPRQPWAGVRDCFEWAPIAPQGASGADPSAGMGERFRTFFGDAPDAPEGQSEDCLALNIFTPGLGDGAKRPVMVWIHGGGFSIGTGSGARSNGSNLARRRDVVTVSLGHRLGALGFSHLGEFDGDFARSGSAGQLDLIAGLEWVRDNIGAFGGDPARVMVHGESGGGGKIGILLGMPRAQGLFARAILQSGTANHLPDRQQAAAWSERLLAELELKPSQVRELQQLPVERIVAAASALEARHRPGFRKGFVPTQGTPDLPSAPVDAVAAGSAPIPVTIGCTLHEAALFLAAGGVDTRQLDEGQLTAHLGRSFGDAAPELLAGYRNHHPDFTAGELLVRILSDTRRLDSIEMAEAHLRGGGAPTWMYLFSWESPVLPELRSAHGIDGTFYFDNTESVGIARGDPEARQLAARASGAWAEFARSGVPAAEGLPDWPAYGLERRETLILSGTPRIESDPLREDRILRQRLSV